MQSSSHQKRAENKVQFWLKSQSDLDGHSSWIIYHLTTCQIKPYYLVDIREPEISRRRP